MMPKGRKDKLGLRIGLQVKFAMILTAIVLAATAAGGWLYCAVTSQILHQSDRQEAHRLAAALTVAPQTGLADRRPPDASETGHRPAEPPEVFYGAIVDAQWPPLPGPEKVWIPASPWPPVADRRGQPVLRSRYTMGNDSTWRRPIQGGPAARPGRRRCAWSTDIRRHGQDVGHSRDSLAMIAGGDRSVRAAAGATAGLAQCWACPIRRLVRATRRLAEGDFTARVETHRNDEIGELAGTLRHHGRASSTPRSGSSARPTSAWNGRSPSGPTELERANRRLREEMAEKEDFLRAVSHDLNAPLRNIAGMATMITHEVARANCPRRSSPACSGSRPTSTPQTELISELLELSRDPHPPAAAGGRSTSAELLEDLQGQLRVRAEGAEASR